MLRTHTCGDINENLIGEKVVLCGWVNNRRDLGNLIFIDLRDRYGITQIISDPDKFKNAHTQMDKARGEYVVRATGVVRERPDEQINKNMFSGKIEVLIENFEILNESLTPPFEINQNKEVGEELRLTYRYLDLRRDRMKKNIVMRHDLVKDVRDFFDENDFVEVETPILIKGTPEGSREYLVPSRLYSGNFYVLPQSPQQLKQLLMVSGMDRYFQIARCFRDEDQRGDRQPEFTQLDVEMSFIDYKDIMALIEQLLVQLSEKFKPDYKILKKPFPVLSYDFVMNTYGSDKPDLRYGLEMQDISEICKNCGFEIFSKIVNAGGLIKAIRVPGASAFTRKEQDELTEISKVHGLKGLSFISLGAEGIKSSLQKFLNEEEINNIIKQLKAENGDLIVIGADNFKVVCESMGKVRQELAKKINLIPEKTFAYCWVIDFPMFEEDKETKKLAATHHPFTAPLEIDSFYKDPKNSKANAYDIVLNGFEIGGGSIRIHDSNLQKKIFDILEISDDDAERRFGHLLRAFKYGAPPHGGIALGIDRLLMLFAEESNIREVIAFPKDQKARDLMLGAPSKMPDDQIKELHIQTIE